MTITPATTPIDQSDALVRIAQAHAGAQEDWADFIGRNLCRLSIRTQPDPGFEVGAHVRVADEFLVGRINTVAGRAQLERGPREIGGDGKDRYALYLPLKGEHDLSQAGREARCGPRAMTLTTMTEPFSQTKRGDNDTLYFFLPRGFVDQRLVSGIDLCGRAVATDAGVQRLARDTVAALQREADRMSQEEFLAAARATGELVLIALSGGRDLMSNAGSVRAGNLARAKRVIRARLSDPDLTLGEVARACGLSLRYLHDLFRDDGRTASEFLICERLKRARRMLEAQPPGGRLVTDIAMACGFSSPSQFATSFRRAFGVSPRDMARRV